MLNAACIPWWWKNEQIEYKILTGEKPAEYKWDLKFLPSCLKGC